jgi:glycosyltransferase involved in cell wall biosynthesis
MTRIIYGAPPSNTPAGGVKVIYRHSELLCELGIESAVWHPTDNTFRCNWFENKVKLIKNEELSSVNDFIVIPEIWATFYVHTLKKLGFRVAIFVQNCYYTHVNLNQENSNAIKEAYEKADLILSISNDSSQYLINIFKIPAEKIILQRYSIDSNLFRPNNKSKTITYMPRKMEQHSARVVSSLNLLIPKEWKLNAIDGLIESEVARNLSESIIFLAFSEFEGLPVPPVEASISGNIVIGYHGQGGREYWKEPNFIEVEQGNVQRFINETLTVIDKIESNLIDIDLINQGMRNLTNYFSKKNESLMLIEFANKIK